MQKKVEILSPAGSYESLKAAIAAGADAVYIGGSRFGARAFADNLSEEKLLEVIDYVHLHGRKIYLTVNTLLKEQELEKELYNYLLPYYRQGLDAVIVQDMGVLQFVKEHFPGLPIHASTQMTITNVLGAKFLKEQGAERVVTAREMSLSEIEEITKNSDVEIESFVHGALCYCYSGQCLYSSLIGGRSGNRGQCAQPCRLPYKVNGDKQTQYVLSLKDICTLEYIPELIEAGIYSFKIEGRMKKPEYVALVTAMYRKYADLYLKKGKSGFKVDSKDREKLMDLYNRGGSHGGYYHTRNGREMVSLTRPNHAGVPALKVVRQNGKSVTAKALADICPGDVVEMPDTVETYTFANGVKLGQNVSFNTHKKQNFNKDQVLNRTRNEKLLREIQEQIISRKVKELIDGELILKVGETAKLTVCYGNIRVEAEGAVVDAAMNQPMDAGRIEKQMRKTGNTEFEFADLNVIIEGNVFMPMQNLNELRRSALEELQNRILERYRREEPETAAYRFFKGEPVNELKLTVYVEEREQFEEVLNSEYVSRIYLDGNILKNNVDYYISEAHKRGKEIYLALPHIFRKNTKEYYENEYDKIINARFEGMLVRNYEAYVFLKQHRYSGKIVMDYNMYQFNQYAKAFWLEEGCESLTAPLELNYKELGEVGLENSELVVYGYFPMMVSAQCVQKTTSGCKRQKGRLNIRDRYNKEFAVKNQCDHCYNIIYNTAPVVLTDQKKEILELQPKAIRMHFTLEDKYEVKKMLRLYEEIFWEGKPGREPDTEFTRGHFKRGIK